MAAGATTVIDIVAQLTDKTAAGTQSAIHHITNMERSINRLQERMRNMKGMSRLEVVASLKDMASQGIKKVVSAGKQIAGKVWDVTVKLTDLATAPLKKLWSIASNPITQAITFTGVSLGAADTMNTYKDFEQGMANVKAVSGASDSDFEALTETAKNLGETTQFSASQAAQAMENLAMAGWKANSIISGMPGLLDLAAAGSVDLATASDVVASAIAQFGYEASESGKIADVLAATATNSKTDVEGLGESLKYAGPLAGSLGYSIEDVALALGLMGNNAIDASTAGTTLRSLFTRMGKQGELTAEESNDVANAMKKVGVSMTDSTGKMRPLMSVMKDLRSGFSGLSQAEKTQVATALAGQEAMSGLLAIVNASDEDFETLTKAIGNSTGAAKEMAGVKMDTLEGSILYLQSAVEGLQISVGEKASPFLKMLIDGVTAAMPKVQQVVGQVISWISGKAQHIGSIITSMVNSEEWENADLGGKIGIAWDKVIEEPFLQWFNTSGKSMVYDALGELFSNAGKILPGGEKPDFSSWLSAGLIVEGAKPIVSAAKGIFDIMGKLPEPLKIAGDAALIAAGAIGAVATAIDAYNQKKITNNLNDHFGDIELSAQEAAKAAEIILNFPAVANLELALGEMKKADELRTQAEGELRDMKELEWLAKINMGLGETDSSTFMEKAINYGDLKMEELKQHSFSAYLTTDVFLGDTKEGEDLKGKIIDWAAADIGELQDLQDQLKTKLQAAMTNGVLGVDDLEVVSKIREKMDAITQKWYESESQAQLDLLQRKFGELTADELTEGGFRNLMQGLNDRNTTIDTAADEAYTTEDANLRAWQKAGLITEPQYTNLERTANYRRLNLQMEGRTTSMEVAQNTLENAYSEHLAETRKQIDQNWEGQKQSTLEAYESNDINRLSSQVEQSSQVFNAGNGKGLFGIWGNNEDQMALNSMLDALKPDATKMSEIMDDYKESGKAIPEAFKQSYYDAMELMASMGDSDAALETYARSVAESGEEELIKAMDLLYENNKLSDGLKRAWEHAMLETTDEIDMEGPDVQLNGDTEITNIDEWNQKLREKLEQDLSKSDIGTVTGETEADFEVTVKPGNTLSEIGQALGIPWEEIWKYNEEEIPDPNMIFPNQVIKIPKDSIQLDTSEVEAGMQEAIQSLSAEGTGIEVTTEGVQVTFGEVSVDPADTLEKIAAAVGTSVESLREAGITEEKIETGVTVTIPQDLVTVETDGIEAAVQSSMGGETAEGGTVTGKVDVKAEADGVDSTEAYSTAQEETQKTFETPMEADGHTDVTLDQENNRDEIYSQTASEVQSTYNTPISADATVNVNLDWNILNPNKSISVTGSGSGSGSVHAQFNAEGRYVDSPILSVVGEDGPEYIIPVGSKRRSRGMELWMQAGHDLGVPGFANGGLVGAPESNSDAGGIVGAPESNADGIVSAILTGWMRFMGILEEKAEDIEIPGFSDNTPTGEASTIIRLDDYEEEPEPIIDTTPSDGSSTSGEGNVPVTIENLNFEINVDGAGEQDPKALADAIQENVRGMTDEIAYQLAIAMKQAYTNTPKIGWR